MREVDAGVAGDVDSLASELRFDAALLRLRSLPDDDALADDRALRDDELLLEDRNRDRAVRERLDLAGVVLVWRRSLDLVEPLDSERNELLDIAALDSLSHVDGAGLASLPPDADLLLVANERAGLVPSLVPASPRAGIVFVS